MRREIGFVVAAVAAFLVLAPAALAKDMVFWANFNAGDDDTISRANLDGSGGSDLNIQGTTTVGDAFGMAIDASAGKIYWADTANNQIGVANLDGSGASALNVDGVTVSIPRGVTVDPEAGKIYWANNGNAIVAANLDGSSAANLDTTGATVSAPYGVAIDPGGGKIYWSNYNMPSTIGVANLDGSGGGDNLDTTGATVNLAAGIAVDTAAGKAYWANATGFGTLSGADADDSGNGFDISVVFPPVSVELPTGVALDPGSGRIYWGNRNGGGVAAADLDGSNASFISAAGATVSSAMYPVLLKVPVAAGPPEVSTGGSGAGARAAIAAGSELSCSDGEWAPDLVGEFLYRAPESLAFQWLGDGAEIPGASSATFTPEQGGSYSCRVSATNGAGTASQTSDAVQVEDSAVDGSATAKKRQRQKGKSIVVKVKVKAGEDLRAKATGKVKAKGTYKLKPTSKRVRSNKKKTLKLRPKRSKDAKKIAKVLAKGKRAKAKVKVKLTNEAGAKKVEKLSVKLVG